MAPAVLLALALMAANTPPAADAGEPVPASAPTDEYELTAWCYGALGEYLQIYDRVKPDLVDIDRTFGTEVQEAEPYQSDVKAMRAELRVYGAAITAAEKASIQPIAPRGAAAIRQGQGVWAIAETRSRRELARAWLTWGVPDRCGVVARDIAHKAAILGRALSFNTAPTEAEPPPATTPPAAADSLILKPIAPVGVAPAGVAPAPSPPNAPAPTEPAAAAEPATAAEPAPPAPVAVAAATPPTPAPSPAPARVVEEPPPAVQESPAAPPPSEPPAPAPLQQSAPAPAPPGSSTSDESVEPRL